MFAHDRVSPDAVTPGTAVSRPQQPAAAPPLPPAADAYGAPRPVAPRPTAPVAVPAVGGVGQSLATDDIRRLQAVLFELGECRQLLTEALKR
jgi:hypothetical protein